MSLIPVAVVYVSIELLGSFLRLPFLKRTAGLNVSSFVKDVFLKEIVPVVIIVGYCMLITHFSHYSFRFLLTFATAIPIYAFAVYLIGLTPNEKKIIKTIMKK